jgi:hypothetical protein
LDFLGDGLFELDLTGATGPREVIAAPGWINGMDFGPDGFIYAPQWSQAKVVRIDPDSGSMTTVATDFESLAAAVTYAGDTGDELTHRTLGFEFGELRAKEGAAIRADGDKLLVADWTPGKGVEVWDLEAGHITEKYAADFPIDVIRFQGDILVSQYLTNNVAVVGSGAPTPLGVTIDAPTGLAVKDDDLFVASFTAGTVLQIIDDGRPLESARVVAIDLDGPEGLAFLPSGDLVVVESGTGNVVAIDLDSGTKTTLAEGISPQYSPLASLPAWGINGVAVGPSGSVYVSSPRDGKLYRITFK